MKERIKELQEAILYAKQNMDTAKKFMALSAYRSHALHLKSLEKELAQLEACKP